jgi:TRAP-type C4-dicarboxylate transport system substrate-binding protein
MEKVVMKHVKALRVAAAAALLSSTILSQPAAAETITLSIGAGHPAAATWITTIREGFMPQVSERVAAETDHEIAWSEAWGGSVCKIGECLEAVEAGLLDMADLQTAFEPAKLMGWNFTYFVPFGSGDPAVVAEHTQQTIDDIPALKEQMEERYNQVLIGMGVVGNYGLITNFEWDDVSELQGRRIAAAGPNIPWVSAVGIVPVQSNLNEGYTSMQTGVYDGWVMFPDGATSFRLEEVSRQMTITDFGSIAVPILTMHKDTYDALPEDVRAIVDEEGRNWNQRAGEYTKQRQEEATAKLEAAGVRIKRLTAEEKAEWAARLPNIPRERTDEINAAGQPGDAVYHYIQLLQDAGHEFARDWLAER